jgi:hypothetical protein
MPRDSQFVNIAIDVQTIAGGLLCCCSASSMVSRRTTITSSSMLAAWFAKDVHTDICSAVSCNTSGRINCEIPLQLAYHIVQTLRNRQKLGEMTICMSEDAGFPSRRCSITVLAVMSTANGHLSKEMS